jgi:hypothetical protein
MEEAGFAPSMLFHGSRNSSNAFQVQHVRTANGPWAGTWMGGASWFSAASILSGTSKGCNWPATCQKAAQLQVFVIKGAFTMRSNILVVPALKNMKQFSHL